MKRQYVNGFVFNESFCMLCVCVRECLKQLFTTTKRHLKWTFHNSEFFSLNVKFHDEIIIYVCF